MMFVVSHVVTRKGAGPMAHGGGDNALWGRGLFPRGALAQRALPGYTSPRSDDIHLP